MTRLLCAVLLLGGALFATLRATPITTDMAALLPAGRTEASRFLFRELRSGAATTLLLAGIEGAPPAELARLSKAVGAALRQSGEFAFVGNGAQDFSEAEMQLVFGHRYLLSPAVTPELFEAPTLRAKLEALLAGLRSSASPLLVRFGFADPVGAFFDLVRGWLGGSQVQLRDGAWFVDTPQGGRALLVARTRAEGMDTAAQARAAALLRDSFAAARPGGARLLLSGPGVFAAEAAAAIRADVHLVSVASGLLIAAFLLWRYRSPAMLLVVAVPLLAATLAGALAVRLAFGSIHGAAFGFGMTMLGVTVDYPILLATLRRPEETLAAAARRIWPTLRLAAAAAALGLTAMLASGFGGLAQLGLFAASGLAAAAAVTRWVLPWLVPEGRLFAVRPRPLPAPALRAFAALRGRRRWGAGAIAAAALLLLGLGGPRLERSLDALNPVPAASRRLDEELRRQLGAPDVRSLIAMRGDTAEAVLQRSERVAAALAPLVGSGKAIGALELPSRILPSAATQRARQAALPEPDALRERLAAAMQGLPFRPTAFDPFVQGVAESRTLPPLTRDDLAASPTLSARLDPLLARRGGEWVGLALPSALRDPAALRDALAALHDPDILFVDVKAETEGLLATYTAQALFWAAIGAAGVLAVLALGLGSLPATLRRAAPVGGALLVTLALLTACGVRLTLFHLASLLLLAGVAMDYTLFLARSQGEEPGESSRTLESVLNCASATLLSFGLLAFCETPVLRAIGTTVSAGVIAAFLLACTLAPPPEPSLPPREP